MDLRAQLNPRGRRAALPLAATALLLASAPAHAAVPAALPPSSGATYHVSPSGSDSASGSASAPWKTIGKALSTSRPGARILVRAGTYSGDVSSGADGAAGQTMTLEAYPGERPVLHVKLTLKDANHLRISGLAFKGSSAVSGTAIRVDGGSNVELSGNEITGYRNGGSSQAILVGSNTVTKLHVVGNRIHDTGIWDEHDHGIYCKSSKGAYIANNLFYNLDRGYGIHLYNGDGGSGCDDSLIVNNTVDGNQESGLVVSKAADRNVVANNIFSNHTDPVSDHGYAVRQGSGAGTGNVVRDNLGWNNRQSTQFDCSACSMSGNVKVDPRFANRAAGDFSLLASSGAVGLALGPDAPAADFSGVDRPQGGAPDAGAFELKEGLQPAPAPQPEPQPAPEPAPQPAPQPAPSYGTVDLARARPATASSRSGDSRPPSNAVDGVATSRWSSGYDLGDGQWLQVDLGSAKAIGKVDVNWSGDYATSYEVRASTDGVAWAAVASGGASAAGVTSTTFPATTARYVRVVQLARRAGAQKVDVYELKVF